MPSGLPDFDADGLLPAGDYELSLGELQDSILVRGPRPRPAGWDSGWRLQLVQNLGVLVGQLWEAGITDVYVDGSFVEDKLHPNDIDGYFRCSFEDLVSGDRERRLNRLDPYGVWTWDPRSRRSFRGYPKLQLPMWHRYRVELYPHTGQLSGLRDAGGHELEFPSAFRMSPTGRPRGIVKIRGQP